MTTGAVKERYRSCGKSHGKERLERKPWGDLGKQTWGTLLHHVDGVSKITSLLKAFGNYKKYMIIYCRVHVVTCFFSETPCRRELLIVTCFFSGAPCRRKLFFCRWQASINMPKTSLVNLMYTQLIWTIGHRLRWPYRRHWELLMTDRFVKWFATALL